MEAILAFARENGFEQLNLEVHSSNARAIRRMSGTAFGGCARSRTFSSSTGRISTLT